MKKTGYYKLIIVVCIASQCFQSTQAKAGRYNTDSLKALIVKAKPDTDKVFLLNTLSYAARHISNYPLADSAAQEAIKLAMSMKYDVGISVGYSCLGLVYKAKGDYATALKYFSQSIDIASKAGYNAGVANANLNMGNIYAQEGIFPEALNYFLKSLKIFEKDDNETGMDEAYGNIGNIYYEQGNYDESLKYQLLSLKLSQKNNDKIGVGETYGNIGAIYFDKGNYDESLVYQRMSLKIKQQLDDKYGMIDAYVNMGNVYSKRKDYAQALDYFKKALDMARETGSGSNIDACYQAVGNTLGYQEKYTLATQYLDSALSAALKLHDKDVLKNTYASRVYIDSAIGNYGAAYNDYKMNIIYSDSLKNDQDTKKLVQEQMQFKFDKKLSEQKAEQDKKDALAEQDKKKQMIIRDFFIAGFVLVLALAFFIFRGYSQKKRTNEIIIKQKREVEIQKELVEEKQKEIVDSIQYAQRIQSALLASDSILGANLHEFFVLHKPKDIVSGDFYWAAEKKGGFYLAVCDSTGHGVPGAFMSLLNISFLNEAINEKNISAPAAVFDHARIRLIQNISQDGGQDGMDGALIRIDGHKLEYAAAYNAPVVVRNNELVELDCDRMPVGKSPKEKQAFASHSFGMQAGDMLYLFSDGYGDQFGGANSKKFKYRTLCEKLKEISGKSMPEQKALLDNTFESWKGQLEQTDDVCVVGIRF